MPEAAAARSVACRSPTGTEPTGVSSNSEAPAEQQPPTPPPQQQQQQQLKEENKRQPEEEEEVDKREKEAEEEEEDEEEEEEEYDEEDTDKERSSKQQKSKVTEMSKESKQPAATSTPTRNSPRPSPASRSSMSAEPAYKLGDLVWAKMKGFSPWPGRISKPLKDMKKPASSMNKKVPVHCVYFFGTNNFGWIDENNIKAYREHKETCLKLCKTSLFKEACQSIEDFIDKGEVFEDSPDSDTLFEKLKEESNTSIGKKTPKIKPKKETPKLKRESSAGSSERRSAKKQRTDSNTSSSGNRLGSLSPALNHSTPMRKSGSLLDRPGNITRPDTPPLDVETLSQTLKDKNIRASDLKFGFLGLGIMGSGIVKNLLNSGHKVIVWNRTQEKCSDFVKAGAEQGLTPSDVVLVADITFSCVADPQAAKEMVFGNCGVLTEITTGKGYVEMTGIDAETSQDIAEAITAKGARYLEAQVQGSKVQAEEGTLVILAAGDRELFDDCESCIRAMGKHSFYLGEVGNASKMNLVLQLMAGVTLAGLAESMALADRAGLQQKDVLEILELTSLACPAIMDKGQAIIEGGFATHQPLQHMQKDLRLSLSMSDQLEQPIPLAAAANEIYKHAKRLGYGEHDASAVYIRARF